MLERALAFNLFVLFRLSSFFGNKKRRGISRPAAQTCRSTCAPMRRRSGNLFRTVRTKKMYSRFVDLFIPESVDLFRALGLKCLQSRPPDAAKLRLGQKSPGAIILIPGRRGEEPRGLTSVFPKRPYFLSES